MSNMVEKLEQEIGDPLKNRALCPYKWFQSNHADKIEVTEVDADGPVVIDVHKPWTNQVEIWKRHHRIKNDWMFEKVGSYPMETK